MRGITTPTTFRLKADNAAFRVFARRSRNEVVNFGRDSIRNWLKGSNIRTESFPVQYDFHVTGPLTNRGFTNQSQTHQPNKRNDSGRMYRRHGPSYLVLRI